MTLKELLKAYREDRHFACFKLILKANEKEIKIFDPKCLYKEVTPYSLGMFEDLKVKGCNIDYYYKGEMECLNKIHPRGTLIVELENGEKEIVTEIYKLHVICDVVERLAKGKNLKDLVTECKENLKEEFPELEVPDITPNLNSVFYQKNKLNKWHMECMLETLYMARLKEAKKLNIILE